MTTDNTYGHGLPNHPIPKTAEGVRIYRRDPAGLNSPVAPGGEVAATAIAERAGSLARPSLAGHL
jgi:hypothetical protein